MAILTGPVLSFNPSGTVDKSIVFYPFRGRTCVRSYIIPPDPKTPRQMEQRSKIRQAVDIWHSLFQDKAIHDGWQCHADTFSLQQSGYNLTLSNIIRTLRAHPDPSFAISAVSLPSRRVSISMRNIISGLAGDEAGNFTLHWGYEAGVMPNVSDLSILPDGTILSPVLGDPGRIVYWQLSRVTLRSGITQALLA